ncbi:MAG: hypothetical protein M0Z66_15235 [Thermaerobacter sp.]|nr:hypothetical protein [Thermaerobacter sp.]
MDVLSPYTKAVAEAAKAQGRMRLCGIRFSLRGMGERLDAELLSFAGAQPREERVLVIAGTGQSLLWLQTFPDLAARLAALEGSSIAP